MKLTLDIPDDVALALAAKNDDPARVVLEAALLEGYRRKVLFEEDLRRALGYEIRWQVQELLGRYNMPQQYDVEDAKQDLETIRRWERERITDAA